MKKGLILLLLLVLTSCETDPVEEEQNDLYDPRSLVTEECSHLDNIGEWQPVWCDEFDVDGLPNGDKWGYDTGGSGWGNNELQYYTYQDLDNASVTNGILSITAVKENMEGKDYTSARLVSKYRGDWLYGRIQIKAKLPAGLGTWGALWMLPTDWEYGGWPDSGEIDIMEYVGYEQDTVFGTIHTGAYNHTLGTQVGENITVENAETTWHVYEMVWQPGEILLFVDGVQYATFGYTPESNVGIENSDAWPFDKRFHLIMNLAIGGDWGGSRGLDTDIFPTAMEVDYVRVYQKDYAGLDLEAPSVVSNLRVLDQSSETVQIAWNHAVDDVRIKEYEILINNIVLGTTTINSFTIGNLDPETDYTIHVRALDFDENYSDTVSLSVTTLSVPSITSKIEAEDYNSASGIDTQTCEDVGGGENVGWIDLGDYMKYNLVVEESGDYTVSVRVASNETGGTLDIYNGSTYLTSVTIPVTEVGKIGLPLQVEHFHLMQEKLN